MICIYNSKHIKIHPGQYIKINYEHYKAHIMWSHVNCLIVLEHVVKLSWGNGFIYDFASDSKEAKNLMKCFDLE